ncbi:hypothetical protein ABSA28_00547 [Candidatus Hepatincolaceae symbiont of Richtersius coronifer]
MINPNNILIIWGEYTINEMFNVISIGKPPATSPYSLKQEIMPNRKSRTIASANTENDLTITVDGSVVNRKSFNTLIDLFNSNYNDRLRLVNKDTGDILVQYSKAILTNTNFLEGIEDSAGTNAVITLNCINEG